MINLLPPELKQEIKYSRWNGRVVHYLTIVIGLALVVGSGFAATSYSLYQHTAVVKQDNAAKASTIAGYKSTIATASALNERVAAIKTIQASQPKFSLLLSDIAKFSLKGTAINSISLTGADSKLVQITATSASYIAAVSLRDALAASPRISAADLISVASNSQSNTFTAVIVIGFKPGQAR